MVEVKLVIGEGYIPGLVARMRKHGISQRALACSMDPPASATQVSRWFTANPDRRVEPEMRNVRRIEEAMARLIKARSKPRKV